MSSIQDPDDPLPRGGDGPNRISQPPSDDPEQFESVSGSSAEQGQDEGGGEGGGSPGGEGLKASSKGINPVQHSE